MEHQRWAASICEAIRTRRMLEFDYHGKRRVVHPYCHGVTPKGNETLRAIQVSGAAGSRGITSGKLWTIGEIERLRVLDETFRPDDPNYNPADSAMAEIHCRVERP